MAQRFWVGGTGTWSNTTGHWALITGGTNTASAPTSTDDAIFDGNSGGGTVTISGSPACKSCDTTNFTGTIAGSTALTVSDGGWIWGSAVTVTYTGTLTFASTSGTLWSITSNSKQFAGSVTLNGAGGSWQLGDAFSMASSSVFTLTAGTFNQNSQTIQCGIFSSSNTNTRSLTLNAGLTLTGTGTVINLATQTGLTFSGSTCDISLTNTSSSAKSISFGTLAFRDITISGSGSGTYTITTSSTGLRDFICSNNGGAGVIFSGAATYRNVDFTSYTGTVTGTSGINIMGNLTFSSTMTNSISGACVFNGTSGTQTITSNGKSFVSPVTINNTGATVSLADSFVHTTGAFTFTAGAFTTNSQNFQVNTFASTNSNTRSLNISNSAVSITATSGITWSTAAITNLTFTATGSAITFAGGSFTSGALTFGDIVVTGANAFTFSSNLGTFRDVTVSGGSATISTTGSIWTARNINFSAWSGTLSGSVAINVTGNLTMGSGVTMTQTGAWTFIGSSGTQSVTTNGASFSAPLTANTSGSTVQLADNYTSTSTITLTAGTLDFNSKNVSCTVFASSNSNTRTLALGNSQITITSSSTSWNIVTATNLTLTTGGTSKIILTYAGSGAITIATGGKTYDDFNFSGGCSGVITFSGNFTCRDFLISGPTSNLVTPIFNCRNLNFTGFTGIWNAGSNSVGITGDLTYASGMTSNATAVITFTATSGTQNITSNGITINNSLSFNGAGATFKLADTLNTNSTLLLSAGTFDTNDKAVTALGINLTQSAGIRAMNLRSSSVTVTGAGLVWTAAGNITGLTFNAGTSTITLGHNSGTTIQFNLEGLTYNNIILDGIGTGTFLLSGSATCNNISFTAANSLGITFNGSITIIDTVTLSGTIGSSLQMNGTFSFNNLIVNNFPKTLFFPANTTTQIINFVINNSISKNYCVLESNSPGALAGIFCPNGFVGDYIIASNIAFPYENRWYLGNHSIDNGGNELAIFSAPYRSPIIMCG